MDIVYYPQVIYAPGIFTITQISDVEPGHNFQDLTEYAASQPGPQFTGSHMASPDNRFRTTQIKSILDATFAGDYGIASDLSGGNVDTEFKAGANLGIRLADAGLVHLRLRMQENAMICWESLSATQGGLAELSCRLVAVYNSATGNDPMVSTASIALSQTSAVNHLFTLGPVWLNGAVLQGVQDARLDNNIQYEEEGGEGDAFITYAAVRDYRPVFTLHSRNLAYLDTYGERGTAVSSFFWWLRKKLVSGINVPDATVEHILFSATQGTIKARRIQAGGRAMAEVTVDLHNTAQNLPAYAFDTTSDIDLVLPP